MTPPATPAPSGDTDQPFVDTIIARPPEDTADGTRPPFAPLVSHSAAVSERTQRLLPEDAPEHFRTAAAVAGWVHDIGKAAPYFQWYIRTRSDTLVPANSAVAIEPRTDEQQYHAFLGSIATVYILSETDVPMEPMTAAVIAVAKHHNTPYVNPREYSSSFHQKTRTEYVEQLQAIEQVPESQAVVEDLLTQAATVAGCRGDVDCSFEAFKQYVTDGQTFSTDFRRTARNILISGADGSYSDTLIQMFSAIVAADKTCSTGITDTAFNADTDALTRTHVEQHIDGLQQEATEQEAELNALRDRARTQTVNNTDKLTSSDSNIGTITLPTGVGKTLTGIETALKLQATQSEPDNTSRIIYTLPYTSIIDQTANTLRDIFGEEERAELEQTSALTIDHYLSNTATEYTANNTPVDPTSNTDSNSGHTASDAEQLLGDTWNSAFTLTTFVQLFESIFCPENTQSVKVPHLQNSIIILDEPQAMPPQQWPVIERVIRTLIDTYDATIIFMTATQPRLLEAVNSPLTATPLTPPPVTDECFDAINRVTFTIHDSIPQSYNDGDPDNLNAAPVTYPEAADEITSTDTERILGICNLKDSAHTLYTHYTDTTPTLHVNRLLAYLYRNAPPDGFHGPGTPNIGTALTYLTEHIRTQSTDWNTAADIPDFLTGDDTEHHNETHGDGQTWDDVYNTDTATDCNLPIVTFPDGTIGQPVTPAIELTTHHRPRDRTALITAAQHLEHVTVISTQLVEAGVDFSFNHVYRDYAPLTNIVQAAGRCNRTGTKPPNGTVTVWRLTHPDSPDAIEPDTRLAPSIIYSAQSLTLTTDTLADLTEQHGHTLAEATVTHTGISHFTDTRAEQTVSNTSSAHTAVTDYNKSTFTDAPQWSLINDTGTQYTVYVIRTPAEHRTIAAMKTAINNHNWDQFQTLEQSLADCRVTVPIYDADEETSRWVTDLPPLNKEHLGPSVCVAITNSAARTNVESPNAIADHPTVFAATPGLNGTGGTDVTDRML